MRRRGLPVVRAGEESCFSLPCPHHRGGACANYADRPSTCAGFRCALLGAYTDGSMGWEESLARVGRLKDLVAQVRRRIPGADGRRPIQVEIAEYLGAHGDTKDAAFLRENAELLLDIRSIEILAERDFRDRARGDRR